MLTRIRLVTLLFIVVLILLVVRLFSWQILRGGELSNLARGQYQSGQIIPSSRGNILAADGSWLVAKGEAWLVSASLPDLEGEPRRIAEKLAPFFIEENNRTSLLNEIDRIVALLTKKESVWVPLKHKVSGEVKRNIEALKIPSISFEKEDIRIYPEASTAAQLLGFVGKSESGEDIGYFGLEGYYNLPLSGKPGFSSQEKDARGIPILLGNSSEISAITGVDLITHIDKTIQLLLEKRLSEGIGKYGAKGGTAIVANPETGAILGMSSYPSYEPAEYWNYGDEFFRNPAISETFEPGSVFKILVMAAALDAGAVQPDTICDTCDGPLKVDKYLIETWNQKYRPDSDMTTIIVNSDNVGMAFVAQKLGADKLYDYLDNFGIGKKTDIDLQGEDAISLRKRGTWNIVDLSTAGFGQGVAVTPIQLVKAASVIANGGVIVTPQVVAKLQGEGWEEAIKPQVGKRVLSEKTTEEIKAMMVEAAKSGESKWTNLAGFNVAGKTGTAQIPIAGHYDAEKTIASFVGFAPADKPKFIMLVTLKEPQSSPWASETAAPLWYSIAKDLFPYLGIQPE
jgi:cell division protein FtsI/penicillin-binding protein 2